MEQEVQKRIAEVHKEIGTGRAYVSVDILGDHIAACIYTHGVAVDTGISVRANGATCLEALDNALTKLREKREAADTATVERMALAIIQNTYRFGSCDRSQLRHDFGGDVDRLADRAVEEANKMGDSGPFVLTDEAATANAGDAA